MVLLIILAALVAIFLILGVIALIKKPDSIYANDPEQKNPMEGKRVIFVENENEKANADGVKGHLEAIGKSEPKKGGYIVFKRVIDIILSYFGLIVMVA